MPATYDDANVLLQLSRLFGDWDLGVTSGWVNSEDFPSDYEAFLAAYPPGSDRFNELMRYAGYFETMATLWKHDLFDGDLLFDWTLVPWRRVAPVLEGFRRERGIPQLFENFEALGHAQDQWEAERA